MIDTSVVSTIRVDLPIDPGKVIKQQQKAKRRREKRTVEASIDAPPAAPAAAPMGVTQVTEISAPNEVTSGPSASLSATLFPKGL